MNLKITKQDRQALNRLKCNKTWRKEHPWYNHYSHTNQRCNNPNNIKFKNYGGRGIKFLMTVEDFKFLWFRDKAWLLNRPSIDREDNDGNYILDNCRFIELSLNSSRRHRGSKHPNAKLNEKQVLEIRGLYKLGNITQRELGLKYGVGRLAIHDIIHGRNWGYLK
jgi:hypothetical protein